MVLADVITIVQAAKTGVEHVRDWQDDRRDIDAFDAFEQRFIETLETALENLALSSTFNCPMDEILDRYYDNREQILEQVAEIDIINEQQALDTLVEEMVAVIVKELDEEINQQELEKAVRAAYRETLKKYISDASKDDQLQLRMSRDIQADVDTILDELTNWKQQLNPRPGLIGRQERFRLLYPATDADWDEVLSTELGVEEEHEELAFLPPDGFSNVTDLDTDRVLLAGRKGSGKSRTLFEGVVELVSAVEFDRVVVITEPVAETSDLSKAFQDVDGNALLVFDDFQKSVKKDFDFEDALTELEQRVDPKDLYVRAATRSEDLDTVLPDDYGLDNLAGRRAHGDVHEQWTAFHPEQLPPLEDERLEQFVGAALEFEDVTASAALREEFVEAVLERDPTPFYVTSVCANAGDRLTRNDLENLPETAVNAWYNAYDRLDRDQQTLLKEIFLLDLLEVPKHVRVVESIYESNVFSGKNGARVITDLEMKGWLSERGGRRRESQIAIHDIRLEAVERQLVGEEGTYRSIQDFVDRKIFLDFSDFLLENRLVERLPEDLGALLNVNFAEYVYEHGISTYPVEDAQRHFERATEIVRESPRIYITYAQFLGKGHAEDGEIIKLYEEAVNQVSSDGWLHRVFANVIKKRGDDEQARAMLEEGLERIPEGEGMYIRLAVLYKRDGNLEKAIEVLEEGFEYTPNRWVRSNLAALLGQDGQLEKAIEVLEEGLENAPGDSMMRRSLAELWEQDGDLKKAIEVLEEGLEHAPSDSAMRRRLAELWEQNGDLKKAIEVLEEGLEHAPSDSVIRSDLAELWKRDGDLDKVVEIWEKGIEHAPADSWMRRRLAELWEQNGDLKKAIEVLEEGLEHAPSDSVMRSNLAGLWEQNGDLKKAIEVLEEGLEHAPDECLMRSNLAGLWERDGDLKKAIKIYKQGIEHAPDEHWMRSNLAGLWERDGDLEKAIEVLEEGLGHAPGDSEMRSNLAELWEQDSDLKKAIEVLEEGLEHAPADSRIRSNLAELWEQDSDLKKAIEVLEEGLEHAPADSRIRSNLAELWEQDSDIEKAIEVLEEGIEHAPGDSEMRSNLAVLLAEYYDLEEAIDRYGQIGDPMLNVETNKIEFAEMLKSQEMIEEANAVRDMQEQEI